MSMIATSLIRRRLRQRFGISAPKVAVRAHIPWRWRILILLVLLLGVLLLSFASYWVGSRLWGAEGVERHFQMGALESELLALRQRSASGESAVQMERAAKERLLEQVAQLERENAALKEDLAFFDSIVPGGGEGGVRISRFKVAPDVVEGRYRYRLLAVMDAGKVGREFKGVLRFNLKVRRLGKDVMIDYPPEGGGGIDGKSLEIKRFLRLEGAISVPNGGDLKGVEARLLQDGVIRARQSVDL